MSINPEAVVMFAEEPTLYTPQLPLAPAPPVPIMVISPALASLPVVEISFVL